MKCYRLFCVFWIGLLFCPFVSVASMEPEAGPLLRAMTSANRTLNYEMAFINVNQLGIEPFHYRHAIQDGKVLAQLIYLDGPKREIVQSGKQVSYFETDLDPFTLNNSHIVDGFPTVAFADFRRLNQYYNFIPVGRMRVADRACEVVRIVAQDGFRYSYMVWFDEKSKLLMRADLLDTDGNTLEQFRVIELRMGKEIQKQLSSFAKVPLPPLLSLPTTDRVNFRWKVTWLPRGFQEISRQRRNLPNIAKPVESRLFSDGLFSFVVNVTDYNEDNNQKIFRQGRRTVHMVVRNQQEIVVVGELPPATAERIVNSVDWEATS